MKRFLLLLLLWAWPGWASAEDSDYSVITYSATYFHEGNTTTNYGASSYIAVKDPGTSVEVFMLVRPDTDPRTAGATDDSAYFRMKWYTGEPDGTGESLFIAWYIVQREWCEGNELASTADSGDCSWNSAVTSNNTSICTGMTPASWYTAGCNDTTASGGRDRLGVPFDTGFVVQPASGTWMTVKIPGTYVDDAFTYGIIGIPLRTSDSWGSGYAYFNSDDSASSRPYYVGWETATSAQVSVGAVTVGSGSMGSK